MKRKGTAESKSAIRDGRKRLHSVDRGRARHRREQWEHSALKARTYGVSIANRTPK